VLLFGVSNAGGVGQVVANLGNFPRFLDIFGIATPTLRGGVQVIEEGQPVFGPGANFGFLRILSCMAWGLGYFGMPQVLLRFMAIEKSSKLRTAKNIAVVWCFISLVVAVAIGLLGRSYWPTLLRNANDSETIFLHLALDFFPPVLAGLVLSGIMAASMSSSDSYMLIASSALANDLMKTFVKRNLEDREVMLIARLAMLVITCLGIWIALSGSDSIFRLVSYAWAGFGASFGPLILFSLFWKRTTLAGAVAGMISGGGMVIIWKNVISKLGGGFGVYELLPAFIISCLVIFIVSLVTKEPEGEIKKEFEAVRKAGRE
jgi:sodium/proline symporter